MKFVSWISVAGLSASLAYMNPVMPQAHASSVPVGTTFTYQGLLKQGGIPANGPVDLQFSLFEDLAGGAQLATTLQINNVALNQGNFTVDLDFGPNVFNGDQRWVEIRVRKTVNGGAFSTLTPRQPILVAPYALYALNGGTQGEPGPQGPPGPQGATGPAGPAGAQGPAGPAGPQGETGAQGPAGADGATGPAGPMGMTGPQGPAGAEGAPGPMGPVGPAGPQGDIGPQGPVGDDGADGADGLDGVSFYWRGSWSNLFSYLPNDVVQFEGSAWIALASNVDDSPNGSVSWELLAMKGDQGEPGPAGATGPQGLQGEVGPQGPQGETGATGAQGPQGDVGPQGPQGETGATGAQGPQGIQGETGATGATGATGPQGPIGPPGPQGPQGPQGASPWALNGNNTNYMPGLVSVGTTTPAASDLFTSITAASVANTKAVFGDASSSAPQNMYGVYGQSLNSNFSVGVRGHGNRYGIEGVAGTSGASGGPAGVFGISPSITTVGTGVWGASAHASGTGVFGSADSAGGPGNGVWGRTNGINGARGVFGQVVSNTGTNFGVYGDANVSNGVGVYGNGGRYGVWGNNNTTSQPAVYGFHGGGGLVSPNSGYGVYGQSGNGRGTGVYGTSTMRGVHGVTTGSAASPDNVGVYGEASGSAYAGYFQGHVHVNGTLSKSAGSFRIDHPLDPENRYLSHSFVESPEMKNIYDGVITTDDAGVATVVMPEYFQALNHEFRYQLTVIGEFAQAIVAEEIQGRRFVIRTSKPSIKVSWQVTGVRQDAWAKQNPIPVEQDKPLQLRGTYLNPEAFNQPTSKSETAVAPAAAHPGT